MNTQEIKTKINGLDLSAKELGQLIDPDVTFTPGLMETYGTMLTYRYKDYGVDYGYCNGGGGHSAGDAPVWNPDNEPYPEKDCWVNSYHAFNRGNAYYTNTVHNGRIHISMYHRLLGSVLTIDELKTLGVYLVDIPDITKTYTKWIHPKNGTIYTEFNNKTPYWGHNTSYILRNSGYAEGETLYAKVNHTEKPDKRQES